MTVIDAFFGFGCIISFGLTEYINIKPSYMKAYNNVKAFYDTVADKKIISCEFNYEDSDFSFDDPQEKEYGPFDLTLVNEQGTIKRERCWCDYKLLENIEVNEFTLIFTNECLTILKPVSEEVKNITFIENKSSL